MVGSVGGIIVIPLVAFFVIRQKKRDIFNDHISPINEDNSRSHRDIDPFVSSPGNQDGATGTLENNLLTVTPFVQHPRLIGRRASNGEKGVLPALPSAEATTALLSGDEKAISLFEGVASSSGGSDPSADPSRELNASPLEHESAPIRESTPDPTDDASPNGRNMQPSSNPVDIQRLFEDRAFEGQLLQFIAQRMDPPRRADSPAFSEDSPPTYRPS